MRGKLTGVHEGECEGETEGEAPLGAALHFCCSVPVFEVVTSQTYIWRWGERGKEARVRPWWRRAW